MQMNQSFRLMFIIATLTHAVPLPALEKLENLGKNSEFLNEFFDNSTFSVLSEKVNVRSGPSMEYPVIHVLSRNDIVDSKEIANHIWLKIGDKAYISLKHVQNRDTGYVYTGEPGGMERGLSLTAIANDKITGDKIISDKPEKPALTEKSSYLLVTKPSPSSKPHLVAKKQINSGEQAMTFVAYLGWIILVLFFLKQLIKRSLKRTHPEKIRLQKGSDLLIKGLKASAKSSVKASPLRVTAIDPLLWSRFWLFLKTYPNGTELLKKYLTSQYLTASERESSEKQMADFLLKLVLKNESTLDSSLHSKRFEPKKWTNFIKDVIHGLEKESYKSKEGSSCYSQLRSEIIDKASQDILIHMSDSICIRALNQDSVHPMVKKIVLNAIPPSRAHLFSSHLSLKTLNDLNHPNLPSIKSLSLQEIKNGLESFLRFCPIAHIDHLSQGWEEFSPSQLLKNNNPQMDSEILESRRRVDKKIQILQAVP